MKKIGYGFLIVALIASCKKNKDTIIAEQPITKTVYVVGYERTANNIDVAKIWKNKIGSFLADTTINSLANKVLVNGKDVYVLHSSYLGNNTFKAQLSKNGVLSELPNNSRTAFTYSITISGTDVYVGGGGINSNNMFLKAIVWKNNVPQTLAGTDSTNATIYASVASGSDVYHVGTLDSMNGRITKLWKNNTAISLGNTYKTGFTEPSIVTNGTDVVVAYNTVSVFANYQSQGHIWKNAAVTNFANTVNSLISVKRLFIQGTDVYALLFDYNTITRVGSYKIWKNGIVSEVPDNGGSAAPNDLFVYGGDIYLCGTEYLTNGNKKAAIWKNGVISYLTNDINESEAFSIFVK